MKLLLRTLARVCLWLFINVQYVTPFANYIDDHYWRDYNGLVPTDAVPGGVDESGKTTYIGQFSIVAEYNSQIADIHTVPATITKGSDNAIAAYNGRSVYNNETSNLKILCASNLYRYEWFSISAQFKPTCRFVTVGLEDDVSLYVGKAKHGKETVTGKVFSKTSRHAAGLTAPYQGGEVLVNTYELLTFC